MKLLKRMLKSKKYGKMIADLDFDGEHGFPIISLNFGYCFDSEGCHGFSEDTEKEVVYNLRNRIHVCNCPECRINK